MKNYLKGHPFQEVLRLHRSGKTTKQMATLFHCTSHNITYCLRKHGIHQNKGKKRHPAYDEVVELLKHHVLVDDIVSKTGVKRNYVRDTARQIGVRPLYKLRHDKRLDDVEWLRKVYLKQNKSKEHISRITNTNLATVIRQMKKLKLPARFKSRADYSFRPRRYPQLRDKKYMVDQMKSGKSMREIALEIGCCENSIIRARVKLGLIKEAPWTLRIS
jgi:DNA-binding CsgD family transcriptional regulator